MVFFFTIAIKQSLDRYLNHNFYIVKYTTAYDLTWHNLFFWRFFHFSVGNLFESTPFFHSPFPEEPHVFRVLPLQQNRGFDLHFRTHTIVGCMMIIVWHPRGLNYENCVYEGWQHRWLLWGANHVFSVIVGGKKGA